MVDSQERDRRRGSVDEDRANDDGQDADADDDTHADADDDGQDADTDDGSGVPAADGSHVVGDGEKAPVDWDDPADPGHDHHDLEPVSLAVVTVSTSRTLDDDPAGDAIAAILEEADHEIATRELVNDDYDGIQTAVNALVGRSDVDAVVATGGTGVTPDDVTVEAVRPLLTKELPGFGELFRSLSRDEIGTRVVATRAIGGIADGVPVFCLPGSESAARLGTERVVVPEVPHLAGLARPPEEPGERGASERMG